MSSNSRKTCTHCSKNFGKSSYYAHLPCGPCAPLTNKDISTYIFCDHCGKHVSKRTFRHHQQEIRSNIAPHEQDKDEATLASATTIACTTVPENTHFDDSSEDEEDLVFFSDSEDRTDNIETEIDGDKNNVSKMLFLTN